MSFDIATTVSFSDDRVRGLLCCALEGGSNYWYLIDSYDYGPHARADFARADPKGQFQPADDEWDPCYLLPFVDGCAVLFGDKESDPAAPWRLDRNAMSEGLGLMAAKYPRHFADFVAENDDAETGDVFLQLCLFGEIVFG